MNDERFIEDVAISLNIAGLAYDPDQDLVHVGEGYVFSIHTFRNLIDDDEPVAMISLLPIVGMRYIKRIQMRFGRRPGLYSFNSHGIHFLRWRERMPVTFAYTNRPMLTDEDRVIYAVNKMGRRGIEVVGQETRHIVIEGDTRGQIAGVFTVQPSTKGKMVLTLRTLPVVQATVELRDSSNVVVRKSPAKYLYGGYVQFRDLNPDTYTLRLDVVPVDEYPANHLG